MSRMVKCPRCGKQAEFSPENPSRPFCSERCKLIDLGQWADEKYAIASAQSPENEATGISADTETGSEADDSGENPHTH